jgi:two-component system NtrC family sensor kinase
VKERTAELETALDDLKRTEVELVNREKMSSLGLLTAGIAHEINNPINFVSASVSPLKRDINDIVSILHKYDKKMNGNLTPEKIKEIEEYKEELDTPYLIEEIQQLLNGIEEGAVRTANIVRGLQKFSRSDEHFIKSSDLIDGIENTLTLLNPQLKDTITVVKNFEPIPYLDCSPGKLNQVFLNILSNAIHAVNNNGKKEKIITVGTRVEDNNIVLTFKDNGMGMTPEVKDKIFDPFFTTKDVGAGTGLGLSISYGIVENHKGDITVKSAPGEGAEFIIKLPIANSEQAAT